MDPRQVEEVPDTADMEVRPTVELLCGFRAVWGLWEINKARKTAT